MRVGEHAGWSGDNGCAAGCGAEGVEMSSRDDFEEWFAGEQGKPYEGMYDFAKAAWQAATERAAGIVVDEVSIIGNYCARIIAVKIIKGNE